MKKKIKTYKDYKMRYSLTTADIGISFKNKNQLKKFIKEPGNSIMRGRVFDHKYRKDYADIINNTIYEKHKLR